jgi:hypothetical protein
MKKGTHIVVYVVVEAARSRSFPLDMLRYDSAAPATERDSNLIERSIEGSDIGKKRILLRRFAPAGSDPRNFACEDRWRSFGWKVVGVFPEEHRDLANDRVAEAEAAPGITGSGS